MRTKSEARRDAIMETAVSVFREVGFDAASMSQIAARVGGSKATLYNYFSSKEELLLAALLSSADKYADDVMELVKTSGNLPTQLHRFVMSLLKLINSPDTIQILRVAISVGGTSDIGRQFYELGTHRVWSEIAAILRQEIEIGTLRVGDPDMMAMLLRSLCDADMTRNLLGAGAALSDEDAERKAQCIVDIFLRVYGAAT
ncbi:TetR/AcrR family transcriptional regulator [Candidimonas sp. SYP-B2681]|uniref:TetR/AcrR family transcriptional regulator n=1 Tax=Candidimonas sp. SYP-B2681 TaxID=2497686 RepID=UPI000F879BCE|nr:TetR/AcrR family transcriptional regulator [Candidimonas sp. SYP-B2681]RTZ47957.1 TetR/AcrR family transcriptional regulator [Candidimonas sp. SYP-B2681]